MTSKCDRANEVSWQSCVIFFVIAVIIVLSRRPDAILNAQFWAEDGKFWYAEAYNNGIASTLFLPHNGYLEAICRVTAALEQLFPLRLAPLVSNAVAIIVQVLPAVFFTSSRLSGLVPNLKHRMVLSFLYLAIPGSAELHANLTNAQWHLGLLAFLVIIAAPARNKVWQWFDYGVILLSGLSGPFSILLLPVIFLRWLLVRDRRLLYILGLTTCCAVIQLGYLVFLSGGRAKTALGMSPGLFLSIVSGKIFLIALIGQRGANWAMASGWYGVLAGVSFVIGVVTIGWALWKAPLELKLLLLFAATIFAATLISPPESYNFPWWNVLNAPGNGGRYWFFPHLAFAAALLCMIGNFGSSLAKSIGGLICIIMAVGILLDWRHPSYTDMDFQLFARDFEQMPAPNSMSIPINPPGWYMTLNKH